MGNDLMVDEWEFDNALYSIWKCKEDGFYLGKVNDRQKTFKGSYSYEYNDLPDRKILQSDHADRIAEIGIDRHESNFWMGW